MKYSIKIFSKFLEIIVRNIECDVELDFICCKKPDTAGFFEPRLPRRTALNRLGRLRESGFVERLGEARSTVYRLTDAGKARLEKDGTIQPVATQPQADSPLSTDAEALRARLRLPVSQRAPVGYQRPFLESYLPNETFYLPESARRSLFGAGSQTGMADTIFTPC